MCRSLAPVSTRPPLGSGEEKVPPAPPHHPRPRSYGSGEIQLHSAQPGCARAWESLLLLLSPGFGPRETQPAEAKGKARRGEAAPSPTAAAPPCPTRRWPLARGVQSVGRRLGVRPYQQEALPWPEQRGLSSEPEPHRSLGRTSLLLPGAVVPSPGPQYGTLGCTLSHPPGAGGSFETLGFSGALDISYLHLGLQGRPGLAWAAGSTESRDCSSGQCPLPPPSAGTSNRTSPSSGGGKGSRGVAPTSSLPAPFRADQPLIGPSTHPTHLGWTLLHSRDQRARAGRLAPWHGWTYPEAELLGSPTSSRDQLELSPFSSRAS